MKDKDTIKDRNDMDLKEAEDNKKRWQEYTEELYKKDLNSPDNHDGVITHLQQTSWKAKSHGPEEASLWTKLVEVMGFQWTISNLKRWCCESAWLNISANLENSAVATGPEKVSFHCNPEERQCQKTFKLTHDGTHLTREQRNAPNSPS